MPQFIAADTGGTFTDVTVFDSDTGSIRFGKTLTTYGGLVEGVVTGIGEAGGKLSAATSLRHGTTYVINAFLQRRGAKTALIATRGFRDVIEIGRGNRPVPFDMSERREPPLAGRSLRFEVTERITSAGLVQVELNEEELRELVPLILSAGVEAIAISFLNSYANPVHEMHAAEVLRERLPGIYVTTGTQLSREWFEYERTSTAVANAFVGPAIARYAAGFTERLIEEGFDGSLAMMGSNGGVMPFSAAVERPVALVESGPIGGVIAAAEYARRLGLDQVVAFDMGGTTAKCALVEAGSFEIQPTYWVGGYTRGFPIRSPVLDIVEVGAGGGSIAWVDEQARLRVGPKSAGSEPGPACFGRGGVEPTVTDANLWLGRIGSKSFLEGRLPLDPQQARLAIQSHVAGKLNFSGDDGATARVAHGILDMATMLMAGAVKEITVARGHDVRDFTLLAFGGGGPIFATDLARQLGIRRVLIPPQPGNFSAMGMLLAGARLDAARSLVVDLSPEGMAQLANAFEELERDVKAAADREFDDAQVTLLRQVEMRYRGQRHSVAVEIAPDTTAEALRRAFEETYRKRFGRSLGNDFVHEVVGIRMIAESEKCRPSLVGLAPAADLTASVEPTRRPVHFMSGGWIETPVWRREQLPAGFSLTGPAIIEEYSSTTVVGPRDEATIGALGEISIVLG